MSNSSNRLYLNLYIFICYVIFLFLFLQYYQTISIQEWIIIITLTLLAAVFEFFPIVLTSGEFLTLVSSFLLAVGISHGIFAVLCMSLLIGINVVLLEGKNLSVIFFNTVQYSLSAYIALEVYLYLGGEIGHNSALTMSNFLALIAYIIVYFLGNLLFVSLYLRFQKGVSIREVFSLLIDKQSILIYMIMMLCGVLMTMLLQTTGLGGVILFSIVLWFLNISYRHYYKLMDHFRSLSIRDELTGLYNHRYFQEKLNELLESKQDLSLLLMDLDHFKAYNDMFGHPRGDVLLQQVAGCILKHVPGNGVTCRYGGEEFAVILPEIRAEQALLIGEQIRVAVSKEQFLGMEHMPQGKLTVSIGVSSYPEHADTKETLIMLADQALYKIKYTSRNKVQLYTSVIDELKSSFQLGDQEEETIHMIKTFLAIINSKDRYTYGHTERDVKYAEALARKLELPDEEIKYIRYGALLHDIGKVEVPSEILTKQTKLNDEEWAIIKKHVIWGEAIVQPIQALAPCLPIVRHHHERYDGKGYPDGLKGEQIPLHARILTVVDSFDAMTTNRPYQRTKSVSEAVLELRRCAGSQFDPMLITPFIEVIEEMGMNTVKYEKNNDEFSRNTIIDPSAIF